MSARAENLLGAHALEVSDRLRLATEEAVGLGGSAPAALVALLNFAGGGTIDALARVLEISHSGTVRLVDRLVSDGLVSRERSGADARQVALYVTAEGRRLALRATKARERAMMEALEPLSAGEREQLTALLEKLLAGATVDRAASRRICRLCDPGVCGHPERCPVTQAALGLPE